MKMYYGIARLMVFIIPYIYISNGKLSLIQIQNILTNG